MKENVKKFLQAVSKDEALKKDLEGAGSFEAMQKIAAAKGFTFTEDDFKNSCMEEISEDEMKAVAGGGLGMICGCPGPQGIGDGWQLDCFCCNEGDGVDLRDDRRCCGCPGSNGMGI